MAQNPFESLIKQQEQMLRDFTVRNQLIGSMKPANQLVDQFQHQLTLGTTPPLAIVSDLLARYSSLTEPIQRIANQGIDSTLLSLHNSPANDSIQQQMKNIQNNLSSFSLAFESIVIHDNYVDMPEALIPDDFEYEDTPINPAETPAAIYEKFDNTKRLSFSDALTIISFLMGLFLWLLAPFYNHAVDRTLSKEEVGKTDSSMTEEQAQQIIEYLSVLTDYQQSILTVLEVSEESIQAHDSCSDGIQPHSATPDSAWYDNDQLIPTSADEPNDSK